MKSKIRVLLAEDHPIFVEGLRSLIERAPDLDIVAEANNGPMALRLIRELRPDVAVLDISMPLLNGIAVTRELATTCSSARVLVLTLHEERAYVRQALDAGARGYVLKRTAGETLIRGIHAVHGGGIFLDPAVSELVFEARRATAAVLASGPQLTDAESQVLRLTALGYSNKEIAQRLDIGIKSIRAIKSRGAEKLGLGSRAAIIRYAFAQGWLADA